MTIITLDNTLRPIKQQDKPNRAHLLGKFLSEGAVNYDWRTRTTTRTEEVFATGLPTDADLYHTNYLEYLQHTYGIHSKIVLAPHHFWYTMLAEIAQAVTKQPDLHRPLFTRDPEGKINIIVPCNNEAEPLRMGALYKEMIGYIPIDTELFLPTFSTSTEMSRLASLAAFLETCSPFYNYVMLVCGHPAIKLLGTVEDWASITSRVKLLEGEFSRLSSPLGAWLVETVGPVAERLQAALSAPNSDWFKGIFTQRRCGSGSQLVVDGWFSRLFMNQPEGLRKVYNFPTHISKVPYTTLPSQQEWKMCFALTHSNLDKDGFMIPDFSWAQIHKLTQPSGK